MNRGDKSKLLIPALRAAVENDPFIFPRKLQAIIKESLNIQVSRELIRTILLKRLGYTKKKARYFSCTNDLPKKTQDFLLLRKQYIQKGYLFVSLDETSFGRKAKQPVGYSERGQPLFLKRTKACRHTVSVVAVASKDSGFVHTCSKEGSFNTSSFLSFLQQLSLPPHTVVLLDNVSFHHSKLIKTFAESKGWHLLYTPPYSPWFNPIEGLFSVVKRHYYLHGKIDDAFAATSSRHSKAFFDKSFSITAYKEEPPY
jgi:transposase